MADNALSDQIPKRPDQMYSVLAPGPPSIINESRARFIAR